MSKSVALSIVGLVRRKDSDSVNIPHCFPSADLSHIDCPKMEASRGPPRVKNKAPAPQQISAEQLLREAVDRQEPGLQAPTQRFADLEELHEFQGRKRKEFEDYVRRNRINMNNWMR